MTTSDTPLLSLLVGAWQARALQLAAELGVADQLAMGPRPVTELARDLGLHADALYRLLRALAQIGVFRELDERRFANTEASNALRTDLANSLGPRAAMLAGLAVALMGGCRLQHPHRTSGLGARARHALMALPHDVDPRAGQQFAAGMTALSAMTDSAGGRRGEPARRPHSGRRRRRPRGISHRHPRPQPAHRAGRPVRPTTRGRDCPRPARPSRACHRRPRCSRASLQAQTRTCSRTYCTTGTTTPALASSRTSGEPCRLTAVCSLPRSYSSPVRPRLSLTFSDLHMLVTLHGRERGTSEMHSLFAAAGLSIDRIVSTGSLFSVIEAIPALPAGRAPAGQASGRCTSRQGQTPGTAPTPTGRRASQQRQRTAAH